MATDNMTKPELGAELGPIEQQYVHAGRLLVHLAWQIGVDDPYSVDDSHGDTFYRAVTNGLTAIRTIHEFSLAAPPIGNALHEMAGSPEYEE